MERITRYGLRWYLHEDGYYRNSRHGLLHRYAYTQANGPIPPGMHVHHADHDKSNNDPANLVLHTPAGHWAEHGAERGGDWHSRGGRAVWGGRAEREFTCEVCGAEFRSRAMFDVRMCSDRCRDRSARAREQRVCVVCGGGFECQARYATVTCSRSCTSRHAYRQRARSRPDGSG